MVELDVVDDEPVDDDDLLESDFLVSDDVEPFESELVDFSELDVDPALSLEPELDELDELVCERESFR